MRSETEWLFDRLRQEAQADGFSGRWKSILKLLTRVDESTNDALYGAQRPNCGIEIKGANSHNWNPALPGNCQPGEGGSRTPANTFESTVRRNVVAVREAGLEGAAVTREERRLAALAGALIDKQQSLTPAERRLVQQSGRVEQEVVADCARRILAGEDVLGTQFCSVRSSEKRRVVGATYTPSHIVEAMISWAAEIDHAPERVVDPGIGSGRFMSVAADRFPNAILVGIDIDPLALLMARANACVRGYANRLHLELGDYRAMILPKCEGRTLFIGNPPYVRHHDISKRWKAWFATTAKRFGIRASKLAGLHIHFFLRTRELAKLGDYGAFITAAEWLDVNYGSTLRNMLANGLGGTALHVLHPNSLPFADVLTTGAITCFRVGYKADQFTIRSVDSLSMLAPLSSGRNVPWSELEATPRWSTFVRSRPRASHGEIEIGELFRVHRGQVTGCNAVWIAGEQSPKLPRRFLFQSVTKARELLSAGEAVGPSTPLRNVIDLPVDLSGLSPVERAQVDEFLAWAKRMNADKGFVARHRRAWWAVGLRNPAPILCTYMARRAPAFVRNRVGARHLNIAHGLYPVEPMSEEILDRIARHLRETVCITDGRIYAGGLAKFEPGEISRLRIPEPSSLHALS